VFVTENISAKTPWENNVKEKTIAKIITQ